MTAQKFNINISTISPYLDFMAKTIDSKEKKVNQVKVNFTDSEIKKLDELKEKLRSDRSSILRESFFKYDVLVREGSLIMKEIYKLDAIGIKNWSPIYTDLDNLERESKEISNNLKQFIKSELRDNSQLSSIYERLLSELDKLLNLNNLIADFRTKLYKANNEYDIPICDLTERLDQLFNDNDIYFNSVNKKNEDNLITQNLNIDIIKIYKEEQVFLILDSLKKGNPILVNLDETKENINLMKIIIGNIQAGAYALNSKRYSLSETYILFAPCNISIAEL